MWWEFFINNWNLWDKNVAGTSHQSPLSASIFLQLKPFYSLSRFLSSRRVVAHPLVSPCPSFSPSASIYPSPATDCHLMFSVRSDGGEKKSERQARGEEEAINEGRGKKKHKNSMGAQDGGWDEDLVFKVSCACVRVSFWPICTKRGDVCNCVNVNGVFELTFVSLYLFVCRSVFVCVCVWVGTHPQRAVPGGGSFMISSPKRYIKLPQTLLLFS